MALIDGLRTEINERHEQERGDWSLHLEELSATCANNLRHMALGEVGQQLTRHDNEEQLFHKRLEALADRQHEQQNLLEELLVSVARQSRDQTLPCESSQLSSGIIAVEELSALVQRCGSRCSDNEAAVAANPVAEDLSDRWRGRLELLTARVSAVEERGRTLPFSEVQETMASHVKGMQSELHSELDKQLRVRLCRTEEECVRHAAHVEALAEHTAEGDVERRGLAEMLAAQATCTAAGEKASASAEDAASSAAAAWNDGRATLIRLEARFELAEAKQRAGLQELQIRLDELERQSHHQLCGSEPWVKPLRELEWQLKALLAAQVEDSTAVLQSVALMVEEMHLEAHGRSLPPSSPALASAVGLASPAMAQPRQPALLE